LVKKLVKNYIFFLTCLAEYGISFLCRDVFAAVKIQHSCRVPDGFLGEKWAVSMTFFEIRQNND
jgi:hypothetical protein